MLGSSSFLRAWSASIADIKGIVLTSFGPLGRDHLMITAGNELYTTRSSEVLLKGYKISNQNIIAGYVGRLIQKFGEQNGDGCASSLLLLDATIEHLLLNSSELGGKALAAAIGKIKADLSFEDFNEILSKASNNNDCKQIDSLNEAKFVAIIKSAFDAQFTSAEDGFVKLCMIFVKRLLTSQRDSRVMTILRRINDCFDSYVVPVIDSKPSTVTNQGTYIVQASSLSHLKGKGTTACKANTFFILLDIEFAVKHRTNFAVRISSEEQVKDLEFYSVQRIAHVVETLKTLNVGAVFSIYDLPDPFRDFFEQQSIFAIQRIPSHQAKELAYVSAVPFVHSINELRTEPSRYLGKVETIREERFGNSNFVVLEGLHMPQCERWVPQIVIRQMSTLLLKQYKSALRKALVMLQAAFNTKSEMPFSTISGGGLAELILSNYFKNQSTHLAQADDIHTTSICNALSAAYVEYINLLMSGPQSRKSSSEGILKVLLEWRDRETEGRKSLYYDIELVNSSVQLPKGWHFVRKNPIVHSVALKYDILMFVLTTLSNILCIDRIITSRNV